MDLIVLKGMILSCLIGMERNIRFRSGRSHYAVAAVRPLNLSATVLILKLVSKQPRPLFPAVQTSPLPELPRFSKESVEDLFVLRRSLPLLNQDLSAPMLVVLNRGFMLA